MTRRTMPLRLATLALATALAACGDDESPAAPVGADARAIDADIAAATGAGIAGEIGLWAGDEAAVAPGFARAGAPPAGTCTRTGNTVTCTGGREGTLEVQRTVTFRDAAGTAQAQYDAATTASIAFATRATGTASGPRFTSTVERERSHVVSGLAGSETRRTWNGTGMANVRSTFTGDAGTREHRMAERDTTTAVVWTVAPTRGAWPESGTIARHVVVSSTFTGERTGSFTARRRVRVTFNGTSSVPLEVSSVTRRGSTVDLTCTLDLAARTVDCGA